MAARHRHLRCVAEVGFAGEHRDDLGDDAEERQRHDVGLRMAEVPEQCRQRIAPRWRGQIRARRSRSRSNSAEVSAGNASRIRIAVTKKFQVKIGIRGHRRSGCAQADDRGVRPLPAVLRRVWSGSWNEFVVPRSRACAWISPQMVAAWKLHGRTTTLAKNARRPARRCVPPAVQIGPLGQLTDRDERGRELLVGESTSEACR
jgi:hypothetical protein